MFYGNGNIENIFNIYSNNPLDQFLIRTYLELILAEINIFISNISLYIIIAILISLVFSILFNVLDALEKKEWSLSNELLLKTVYNIVTSLINQMKGQWYFPFIFGIFIFILINNLLGMIPYSFTPTSHFILTFSLSFAVVIGATVLGFYDHGLVFFSLFVPAGCPLSLLFLLVIIEFISYLSRNLSLGLRLAANIMSGHMLLAIISGFTYNIMCSGWYFFLIGLLPLTFIIAFSGLELAIAFIQAQVFIVLSSSYIKDSLELH